jgi:tetratricopeptide (TPR) repeat protein
LRVTNRTTSNGEWKLFPKRRRIAVSITLLALLPSFTVFGHDSPEHVIEQLTARMEAVGKTPELLWKRATELRALGKHDAAAADLRQALKVRPDFVQAIQDLSRLELAQGRTRQALQTVNRAFVLASNKAGFAPLLMVRAEVLSASGEWKRALADCEDALQKTDDAELDWYLLRSQIQSKLGRFDAAAAGLRQAFEKTGSAVLEAEWIESLIDAGAYPEALARIEPWLADCRWQSSWLLRRARARFAKGDIAVAHADLLAAIAEINGRVKATVLDSALLADRGLAYALLGDFALAQNDLVSARKLGADTWMLRRLEQAVAERN